MVVKIRIFHKKTMFSFQNNNGASPVETQNLASPEQKTQQRQHCIHHTILRILACETQNFASLLWITTDNNALFHE